MPSNLEEEYEEDGFPPMFSGLYSEEDDVWEDEGLTDGIANYNEVDEDLPGVEPNFNDKELGYVDFFGVEDILSDSHNNDCDEFYADEENYKFTREIMTDSFLSIFMA